MAELFPSSFLAALEGLPLKLTKSAGRRSGGVANALWGADSDEFMGHMPYSQGDDLRRVDWSAYGRSDRLVLKAYRPGSEDVLGIVCDSSASMRIEDGRKFVFALRMAAAVGYVALVGGQGVRVIAGDASEMLSPGSRLVELLETLTAAYRSEPKPFPLGANSPRMGTATRVITLSDGMDDPAVMARVMSTQRASRKNLWVAIMSREELAPRLGGRYRFVSAESGAAQDLDVDTTLLDAYGRELAKHEEAWRLASKSSRTSLIRAIADTDPIEFMLNFRHGFEMTAGAGGRR